MTKSNKTPVKNRKPKSVFTKYNPASGWAAMTDDDLFMDKLDEFQKVHKIWDRPDYEKMTKKQLINLHKIKDTNSDWKNRKESDAIKRANKQIGEYLEVIRELMAVVELITCLNPAMSISRHVVGLLRDAAWKAYSYNSHLKNRFPGVFADKVVEPIDQRGNTRPCISQIWKDDDDDDDPFNAIGQLKDDIPF